jgi:hypothetical protein
LLAGGSWFTAGAVAVVAILIFAGRASGGPLDPPAPPGSTLQPLGQMPPDWVLQLDSTNGGSDGCGSSRFECVLGRQICDDISCFSIYDGVLDHETGLVWQRNLSNYAVQSWESARQSCANFTGGERRGWRLPEAGELMSLVDKSVVSPSPSLPSGHPFTDVPSSTSFWTMTQDISWTGNWAWVVRLTNFNPGQPGDAIPASVNTTNGAWCVRAAE